MLESYSNPQKQRFSIHFVARTPSGRKNHFCTSCTIWCIVFVLSDKFSSQEVPSRTPKNRCFKDSWSLVAQTEKKAFKISVWDFWWMASGLGYVLLFCFPFMTSSPKQWPNSVAQICLDSRLKYESLEQLDRFLAFWCQSYGQRSKFCKNSIGVSGDIPN